MNATVRTTEEYIATFPDEIRPLLAEVAAAMRRALPRAEERIRYGMPALMLGQRRALHFAGWKNHVGVYPVPRLDAELEAELAPYRTQKDTVRFLYRDPIPVDLIQRVATAIRQTHGAG
jgi:uncharacterized protein YdhG (YjbR/CyaY superfamily)